MSHAWPVPWEFRGPNYEASSEITSQHKDHNDGVYLHIYVFIFRKGA